MYPDDLPDESLFDDCEPVLPVTLQAIKDQFDRMAEGQVCEPDPDYDFEEYVRELMEENGWQPREMLVIWCPNCHKASYYNGGFTDSCSCCGWYNLADLSEEAITLEDYYEMKYASDYPLG